uniref:Uncharacterized protein n=1 Tax=Chenopodium quinoa TaxID=63459 RepID=A0A803LQX2_CHEQI
MLNDDTPWFTKIICAYCSVSNDKMRTTVAGIMVAFLDNAYGIDDGGQYDGLLNGRLPFPTDVAVDNKEGKRQSYNPGFAASYARA